MTLGYAPENLAEEWDVVVIGTGMGGATTGYELARLGRRVLFLEKGQLSHQAAPESDSSTDDRVAALQGALSDSPEVRLSAGRWPHRLRGSTSFGELNFFAPLGCGSGGSTALYGAALERFSPADFQPRSNFPEVHDSTLPERWPISHGDLRPWYDRAEVLYGVRGTPDPIDRDDSPVLRAPAPLSVRDRHFLDSFRNLGLHPYQAHVGFEFVEGCNGCSAICRRGCKADAARICLLPALERFGARLLPECEVRRLEAGPSRVQSIHCRRGNQDLAIRAKVVVLAAGAYMTPVLLLNSSNREWPDGLANRSGLVGRNLMFHVSDFIAIRPLTKLPFAGPNKGLALNDFYQIAGEKLGTLQSVGATINVPEIMQFMRDAAETDPTWWRKLASPKPYWWRKLSSPAVRLVAAFAYHVLDFKSAAVWATIVEDLPYLDNRIVADPGTANGMRFEYHYRNELRQRVRSFRRRLAEALRPHRTMVLSGENNLNFGHVCGTCRFGDDAQSSVLNRDNRAHGLSNLYVVDASFFPSSGGTNPSLTIAANALRVAGAIDEQLRQELPGP